MPTRLGGKYGRYRTDYVDGRPYEVASKPGDPHGGAATTGLADVLAAQGMILERLSELTGYPAAYLRKMRDEGQIAPRIVSSRISAVLGVTTDEMRGG